MGRIAETIRCMVRLTDSAILEVAIRCSSAFSPLTDALNAETQRQTIEQPKRASGRSFASVVTRKRPSLNRAHGHGAALRRAQSLAGQLGRTGARLAMVESRSLHPGRRQGPPTAGPLADPSTEELGLAGQPSRGQEGAGSGSPQRAARTALRQRVMVRTDRPDSGPRIRRTPTGPAP